MHRTVYIFSSSPASQFFFHDSYFPHCLILRGAYRGLLTPDPRFFTCSLLLPLKTCQLRPFASSDALPPQPACSSLLPQLFLQPTPTIQLSQLSVASWGWRWSSAQVTPDYISQCGFLRGEPSSGDPHYISQWGELSSGDTPITCLSGASSGGSSA